MTMATIDTTKLVISSELEYRIRKAEQRSAQAAPRKRAERRARDAKRRASARRLGNSAKKGSAQGSGQAAEAQDGPSDEWFAERDELVKDRTINYYLFSEFDMEGKRPRWANCGRVPTSRNGVTAKVSPVGVAHFSGYQSCGSVWACPLCAVKIRQYRAEEITEGLRNWLKDDNYAYMVTLTVPHELDQELRPLLKTVSRAWSLILKGRARMNFYENEHVIGTIKSVDLTHGENGWHPHLHNAVLFENQGQDPDEQEKRIREYYEQRWSHVVRQLGGGEVNLSKGVNVRRIKDAAGIGTYVSKISYELTRTDKKKGRKGGRTPWEILRHARTIGESRDFALWREYCEATKGAHAVDWSRHLKKRLLGVDDSEELSDEEIAAQQTDDTPLARVGSGLANWLGNNADHKIRALHGLERNGADGLRYELNQLGLHIRTEWEAIAVRGSPEGEPETRIVPFLELV